MSESGGLWKHQNSRACCKQFHSLQSVEVQHYYTEEEQQNLEHFARTVSEKSRRQKNVRILAKLRNIT